MIKKLVVALLFLVWVFFAQDFTVAAAATGDEWLFGEFDLKDYEFGEIYLKFNLKSDESYTYDGI